MCIKNHTARHKNHLGFTVHQYFYTLLGCSEKNEKGIVCCTIFCILYFSIVSKVIDPLKTHSDENNDLVF